MIRVRFSGFTLPKRLSAGSIADTPSGTNGLILTVHFDTVKCVMTSILHIPVQHSPGTALHGKIESAGNCSILHHERGMQSFFLGGNAI